jgi:glycosyltransferase involved in cell wall biosynthesis
MQKLKIAQVCPRYWPSIGGVQTHVKEISERLVKNGYAIDVLTTDPTGKLPKCEEINGVVVKRFKSFAPHESYHFSIALRKFLLKNTEEYQIIHAHSYHTFTTMYAMEAKKNNKLIFTPRYHGGGHTFFRDLLHVPYKFVGKRIMRDADRIICLSNYEKGLLLSNFHADENKVIVIPNGVIPGKVDVQKNLARENGSQKRILSVSRIEKYKGIQHVIYSLSKINDDVHLDIVGKGPYKKNLINLVKSLSYEKKISFYEDLTREELDILRSQASVFVLLSQHEAFGNAVAEALASTIPCIVANISALQEWVDNRTCYGIDYPIDISKLASMIKMVVNKKIEPIKLQTWDECSEKVSSLYKSVLNS